MDEQKLKSDFHKLIDSFDDVEVLESIYEALNDLNNNEKDIIDDLSEEQLKRLDESIQQVEDGKVVKHDVMIKKINRWLTK
jgi:hypothetical protein